MGGEVMTGRVLLFLALAAIVIAICVIIWDRLHLRRTMRRLDAMLEAAMRDNFREDIFDESLLSAIETKMANYLSSSYISSVKTAAEKEKIKALIADISHQTKTPVANLMLYVQLLEEQELSPEGRAYADALESQAVKLQSLIDALVKLSRLETGILELHPKPGALSPLVEDAVAQFVPKAAEKNIDLTWTSTDIEAVFDAKWTAEALCNLLENAVKYTPPGGRVKAEVRTYEMFCRIDVIDSGPGIPEEEMSKIFQRFYRASAAHGTEGVGIGLYLAREIASGQGGFIKVASPPEGGAVFSLFIPRN